MEMISVKEAKLYEGRPYTIILDLREPESFKKFHIKNAINYPYEKIEKGKYCFPREYIFILYCERGGSSLAAARMLEKKGLRVKSVVGGVQEYKKEWGIK